MPRTQRRLAVPDGPCSRAILTFTFRNCNLMLMFLLEYQDQECVLEVFVWLETVLGKEAFRKLFPVILTDGGSEFSAREEIEEFCDGTKSTTIFYCTLTVFGRRKPVRKIMSTFAIYAPREAPLLTWIMIKSGL